MYEVRNEDTGEHHFFDDIAAALEAATHDVPAGEGWAVYEIDDGAVKWVASKAGSSQA